MVKWNGLERFRPVVIDMKQVNPIAMNLLNDDRLMSDEMRNPDFVSALMYKLYSGDPKQGQHLTFDICEGKGLFQFRDILIGHRAALYMQLFDRGAFTSRSIREADKLVSYVMGELNLRRVEAYTAKPNIVRALKLIGFHEEGVMEDSFKFNGKFMDLHLMAKIRKELGVEVNHGRLVAE